MVILILSAIGMAWRGTLRYFAIADYKRNSEFVNR
jgi:hypothetical protein